MPDLARSELTPAVLLAGGAGRRFLGPSHKLLATFRGAPIVAWSLRTVREAGLEPWLVTGALDADQLRAALGAELDGVRLLANPRWEEGMATSLAAATTLARALGRPAIVVGPADQPLIPAEAWRRVSTAEPNDRIAVATYDGQRANPVRLPATVWHLLPDTGDIGARDLIRQRADLVLEVACPGTPADIDTLEDLARWNS